MTANQVRSTVMVVEDEPVVALSLRRTLEKLGYAVSALADSGRTAVRMAEEFSPDLVLMDIKLRGRMDGIEAAKQIGQQSLTPVVFLTAHGDDQTIARAAAIRHYGFLTKPFRTDELRAALKIAMEQRRVQREFAVKRPWLTTILENINAGVIATDSEGRVGYMNTAAAELTGWEPEAATGWNIEDVYPVEMEDGKPVEICHLRRVLVDRASLRNARFRLRPGDSGAILVEEVASPIFEGERIIGAVSVFCAVRQSQRKGRLEKELREARQTLGRMQSESRALSGHLIAAQESERLRIARELHDNLAQRAALIELETSLLTPLLAGDQKGAPQLLDAIAGHAAAIRGGMVEIARGLHPSMLVDLGLRAALQNLVDDCRAAGATIALQVTGVDSPMPAETVMTFYRIAQEALAEAERHAPGAPVRIRVSQLKDAVCMAIEDRGQGSASDRARSNMGLGLISMGERARLAGGSVLMRTTPEKGTLILVRIPRKMGR
ncbi:MAG TPA: response regulator [Bryobacteraceae bacterium]|nr:response regulator [Bryobacteraceae bacterium]